MPSWYYFSKPTNVAFHNLLPHRPSYSFRALLSLGLKFVPTPSRTPCPSKALERHHRDLLVKVFFAGKPFDNTPFDIKYHLQSEWTAPPSKIPAEIYRRLHAFERAFRKTFPKKRGSTNLLPLQSRTLKYLRTRRAEFVIAPCDKNLGPALLTRDTYVKRTLQDHLLDTSTYQRLSRCDADGHVFTLQRKLNNWLSSNRRRGLFTKQESNYFSALLRTNECPFAKFYVTIKIHKTPWKTRPIVSFSGCLLYSLGVWLDRQLQQFVKLVPSYIPNSYELKKQLLSLNLPPSAQLFTADAVGMYTNLKTTKGLTHMRLFLQAQVDAKRLTPTRFNAIMTGLDIIMKNNIIQFGDTYWLQLEGTAMGAPMAPPYATITYGHHEQTILPRHGNLLFYRRYIDDVLGIWLPDPDPATNQARWTSFCQDLNGYHGLRWEPENPAPTANFLDLTLTLKNGIITTDLYEKALNLYLYLPPHSNHPNSLLRGLVSGCLHRIHRLCSDRTMITRHARNLLRRLTARGYNYNLTRSLINTSLLSLDARDLNPQPATKPASTDLRTRLFFHLPYHQNNPPAHVIQALWRTHLAEPPNAQPLRDVRNHRAQPIGIDTMTVAYSRTATLGEKLSIRNIERTAGPVVSSYII